MEYKEDMRNMEEELRAEPLAALLRENRPQPPRESRARVRQTLDRIETPPFARVGTFARRAPWGFAAACIALVLLLSGTVYAISSWVGREDYHPGDYITTPADQRTAASAVPEIEQMVRDAAPQSESCRFVMLPEMSDADSLNWWRVKMGQKAYDEADWAWVREIRPEIQEVLYDGTSFAYTVRLHTDHAAAFSREHHGDQYLEALVEQTLYTDSGQKIGTVTGETGLLEETYDGQGITLYNKSSLSEPLQGSGRVSFTAEIAIQDLNVDDMAHIGQLGTVYYTFSFDLDEALKAANADTRTAERRLTGRAVLTQEDGERMWNTPVDLDGVVLAESVSFRSTVIGQVTQKCLRHPLTAGTGRHRHVGDKALVRRMVHTHVPQQGAVLPHRYGEYRAGVAQLLPQRGRRPRGGKARPLQRRHGVNMLCAHRQDTHGFTSV